MPGALLLHRLLARSTPEDLITEMVAYLLREDKDLRGWFAQKIWGEDTRTACDDLVEVEEAVDTQVGGDQGGRVDIKWAATAGRVIFEAKFWAPFTSNQPHAYVADLEDQGGRPALVLIAPAKREQELKRETVLRVQDSTWGDEIGWNRKKTVRLIWISWSGLHKALAALQVTTDAHLVIYRKELIEVIARMDYQYGALSSELQHACGGKFLRDLTQLVWAVQVRLRAAGADAGKVDGGADRGLYYGFYLGGLHNKLWFGVWSGPWSTFGESPLWLQGRGKAGDWLRKQPFAVGAVSFDQNDWVVPVPLDGSDFDQIERRLVEYLSDVARRCADAVPIP